MGRIDFGKNNENTNHLFLHSPFAVRIWSFLIQNLDVVGLLLIIAKTFLIFSIGPRSEGERKCFGVL